ncbi:MAG: hypothetical protein FWC97_07630 [Treponema sp.]|nr:hypothetical protein [Treponema sp.]
MSNKKDFSTASRGLLGLDSASNDNNTNIQAEKKQTKIKTTVELSEENMQFIEDVKTIEGGSTRTVLNGLLDDLRISKRATLDKALEIHNQGRKTWKDLS